jgi:hypothetical protein
MGTLNTPFMARHSPAESKTGAQISSIDREIMGKIVNMTAREHSREHCIVNVSRSEETQYLKK